MTTLSLSASTHTLWIASALIVCCTVSAQGAEESDFHAQFENPFGLWIVGAEVAEMNELGAVATRRFVWGHETEKKAIAAAELHQSHNIDVIPSIRPHGPTWENRAVAALNRTLTARSDRGTIDGLPDDIGAYRRALGEFVESIDMDGINDLPTLRYATKAIQIGNEPNWQWFGDITEEEIGDIDSWFDVQQWREHILQTAPERIIGTYADFVRLSYETIKQQAPDMLVVLGSGALPSMTDVQFADYFDAVDVHLNVLDHRVAEERLTEIRDLQVELGIDKPVVAYEMGAPIDHSNPFEVFDTAIEFRRHAEQVVKMYTVALEMGVVQAHWTSLVPMTGRNDSLFVNPALMSPETGKKPAYFTYKLMTEKLDGVRKIERLDDRVYQATFADEDREPLLIAWSDDGDTTIDLPNYLTADQVKVTQIITEWGKTVDDALVHTQAATSLAVGETPVFVEPTAMLQPGDANQDLSFDQSDIIRVIRAGKYLTGESATWGDGDWNGAPGGSRGHPPIGDGVFDQWDIIAARQANIYNTGPYAANSAARLAGIVVPEPAGITSLAVGLLILLACRNRCFIRR